MVGILTSLGQGAAAERGRVARELRGGLVRRRVPARPPQSARHGSACLLGPIALLAMLAGYDLATLVRGGAVSTSTVVFWGAAAVVVGPVLGVGAAWARDRDPRRVAIGVAPLAGILIGEAVHGLTAIADTHVRPVLGRRGGRRSRARRLGRGTDEVGERDAAVRRAGRGRCRADRRRPVRGPAVAALIRAQRPGNRSAGRAAPEGTVRPAAVPDPASGRGPPPGSRPRRPTRHSRARPSRSRPGATRTAGASAA